MFLSPYLVLVYFESWTGNELRVWSDNYNEITSNGHKYGYQP